MALLGNYKKKKVLWSPLTSSLDGPSVKEEEKGKFASFKASTYKLISRSRSPFLTTSIFSTGFPTILIHIFNKFRF